MPTFSRTTCNGVTAEPEAGSRHTRVERRATERKAGATDSIRETHQLFGHSLATCAKSTSVYPALYPLTVSDTTGAEDWVRRERRGRGMVDFIGRFLQRQTGVDGGGKKIE